MIFKDRIADFRNPDIHKYPELRDYSDKEIYDYFVGCGGLYLAVNMIRKMNLKKGDIVLDLGCGFGSTSIFLAKTFDITVVSVDLWFPAVKLLERAVKEGHSDRIIPLNIDITKNIPFADDYFDAIFCMNSLFMFGSDIVFLRRLLKTLKPGGTFCVGSECFNQEPEYKSIAEVPSVYNFEWEWNVWEGCCSKYHSPEWWKNLINSTNLIDITFCEELEDGVVLWEDSALNYYNYYNTEILSMGAMIPQDKLVDIIIYGKKNVPYTTLYVLSGVRKKV